MKQKKQILAVMLTLCIVIALYAMYAVYVKENTLYGKRKLSSLSPDQCMEFLSDRGISIPEKGTELYESYKVWLKEYFAEIEEHPTLFLASTISCLDLETRDEMNAIRTVVLQYYELPLFDVNFYHPAQYEFLAHTEEERQIIYGEIDAP